MTILVTGPIGSGKSELCRYFRSAGYPVYDCDSRCKSLYETVPGLKSELERALGLPFERFNLIFTDTEKRRTLESMVYPELVRDFLNWRSVQSSPVAFIESAIALQKKCFDGLYDKVLLVSADYSIRLSRNSKVADRDRLQDFDGYPADYVIDNSSSLEELIKQADKFIHSL